MSGIKKVSVTGILGRINGFLTFVWQTLDVMFAWSLNAHVIGMF